MIYTVTLNPSIDYIAHVDRLNPGALTRTNGEAVYPGGKGVNVALVLSRLGLPVRALCLTAGETGAMFERLLAPTGLPCRFFRLTDGMTRINVKIKGEKESELNGTGPRLSAEALGALERELWRLEAGDWLVLSGALPAGAPTDLYARFAALAKSRGARVAVDTAGAPLTSALPAQPDLIKPNLAELTELTRSAAQTLLDVAASAAALQSAGAQTVMVSLGGKGAVLLDGADEALRLPAPTGTVLNTVGAGDSMVAGYLSGLACGQNGREAFRLAVAAGSAAAFCDWLPDRHVIDAVCARTARPRPIRL